MMDDPSNNAVSTLSNTARQKEHVTLTVAGSPIDVVSLQGTEKLGQMFRFEVVCRSAAATPTR